jgi:hypothetical protein
LSQYTGEETGRVISVRKATIYEGELMKKRHSNPVPPSVQAEIDALAALPEEKINTDDIPEVRNWDDAKWGLFYFPIK